MTAKILEGKTLAEKIKEEVKSKLSHLSEKYDKTPSLYAVDTGYDECSGIYLEKEISACKKLGIKTRVTKITPQISKTDFSGLIKNFSADKNCDAVLIPKPLPEHLNDISIWQHLNPDKDIDATSIINLGRLFSCKSFREIEIGDFFTPCTAMAVMELIKYYGIKMQGSFVTVAGRSITVGKPLACMLTASDATVTLCHSKTKDLYEISKKSDILISAIGKANFIKKDAVKPKSVIIDVGTNTDEKGTFCGDVDYKNMLDKVSAITPVPGGVGPVTLACLLRNIVISAYKNV